MQNVLAIVAEYNPLHNGHLYQIRRAKELTNSEYVIAIMSGNFTQRGDTSILNKWEKAKMAINNEVDLVVELPTIYSVSSAEKFAEGAIKIIKELGIVTHISFGMECEKIDYLEEIAELLNKEPEEFSNLLKNEIEKGISFPQARANAIVEFYNNDIYDEIIKGSNNILAIEYLKAIKKYNLNIVPVGIKRKGTNYNDYEINENFASSTAIRKMIKENNIEDIIKVIPKSSYKILEKNLKGGNIVQDINCFEKEIIYKIRTTKKEDLKAIFGMTEGIENSIKEAAYNTNNLEELIDTVKTKRYTRTKIQRLLVNILLDITKDMFEEFEKIVPYIRVLGMTTNGKGLLSRINSEAKLITSLKKFEDDNKDYIKYLEIDKNATNIYTLAYTNNSKGNMDYTEKIEII